MTKLPLRNFHNGATGSVIYVRLSSAQKPHIRSVLNSGLMEVGIPDPASTSQLLAFLAGILELPVARLEVAGDGFRSAGGQSEKMIAIIGMDAATADERIMKHYHNAGKE